MNAGKLGPLLFFVCLFASVVNATQKEPELPKDLPPFGELKPVQAPSVTEKKLANGLTLWLAPNSAFPKVTFVLVVKGGIAHDGADHAGLSDLLAGMLNQGTKKRNAKQIAEEFQNAGGSFSYWVDTDGLSFTTVVLSEMAFKIAELLSDMTQNCAFAENEFGIVKKKALDLVQANEAEPGFLAGRATWKLLFANHPYSIYSGTQSSLTNTSLDDVKTEYLRRFRPDQALLIVAGDFEPKEMESHLTKLMSTWKSSKQHGINSFSVPEAHNAGKIFLLNRPGSVQSTIYLSKLGPKRGDADYAASEVGNTIFGGMSSGRLFENVREEKGYAYSIWSRINNQNLTAIYTIRANVRNEVTGGALNEMFYEMNRMATTSPSQDEVTRAQRYLLGYRAFVLQSSSSIADELASLWWMNLNVEQLNRESKAILEVTADDVKEVSRKSHAAPNYIVVAVGEEKILREQLRVFGLDMKPVE
jgi:zinc protease